MAQRVNMRTEVSERGGEGGHIPVRTARALSSLGSLNATLEPGARPRDLICSEETSRVMGMGKRMPFARRRLSTTLLG